MPTGDVYKVSLFSHTTQRQNVNTHYYEAGSAVTSDPFEEAEALAEAFNTTVLPTWTAAVSSDVTFGCIKIEKVLGTEIPTFISFYAPTTGGRPSGALAPNLVGIIRRRGTFGVQMLRSLLFVSGISDTDAVGSFLTSAFVNGAYAGLIDVLNDVLTSSGSFQNATWEPVIPHTPRVYRRDENVTVSVTNNTITSDDFTDWNLAGFISGPGFRIARPNSNHGSYTAVVTPASNVITMTLNRLEGTGAQVMSVQQATGPTAYHQLASTNIQTALRQLNRRRSSHTGIVA